MSDKFSLNLKAELYYISPPNMINYLPFIGVDYGLSYENYVDNYKGYPIKWKQWPYLLRGISPFYYNSLNFP